MLDMSTCLADKLKFLGGLCLAYQTADYDADSLFKETARANTDGLQSRFALTLGNCS